MRSPLMFVHHPRRLLRSDGVPPSWVGRGYRDGLASNLVEQCGDWEFNPVYRTSRGAKALGYARRSPPARAV